MILSWVQTMVMSVVSAMTGVLPLSESGHGLLFRKLLGLPLNGSADGLLLSLNRLVIAMVILLVFRGEFTWVTTRRNSSGGQRMNPARERAELRRRLVTLVTVSLIPSVAVLAVFARVTNWQSNLLLIAAIMTILGLLVFSCDRVGFGKRELAEVTLADGLLVGLFLGMGTISGLSPVTMAIVMGIWRGLSPVFSLKLSCLMYVPLLILRGAIGFYNHWSSGFSAKYLVGMAVCGVITYLSLRLARFIAQRGSIGEFSYVLWGSAAFLFILNLLS